jgi:hypothetical protein
LRKNTVLTEFRFSTAAFNQGFIDTKIMENTSLSKDTRTGFNGELLDIRFMPENIRLVPFQYSEIFQTNIFRIPGSPDRDR